MGEQGGRGASSRGEPMLKLRADREVTVLAAVAEDGDALQYASVELQNNKEVVLAAVAEIGHALQYASVELRVDRELVQMARGFDNTDRDAVLAAGAQDGYELKYVGGPPSRQGARARGGGSLGGLGDGQHSF